MIVKRRATRGRRSAEMAAEPRIRVYRPGDAPGICRVAVNCFEDSIRPCYEPEGCQAFLAYILPDAIAARQSDGCSAVVAEWENELIGVLELREFSHPGRDADPQSAPGTRGTDGVRRSACHRSLPPSRIHGRRPGNGRIRSPFYADAAETSIIFPTPVCKPPKD